MFHLCSQFVTEEDWAWLRSADMVSVETGYLHGQERTFESVKHPDYEFVDILMMSKHHGRKESDYTLI